MEPITLTLVSGSLTVAITFIISYTTDATFSDMDALINYI